MSLWLLNTIGDIDTDLVERAAEPPAVKERHPVRWTAVIAAALALAVGLGMWFGHGQGWSIPTEPITPSQTAPTHNDSTTEPTAEPTDPEDGPGIGGDDWGCPVHADYYHGVDGELSDYVRDLVGEERVNTYFKEKDKINKENFVRDTTYPYLECHCSTFSLFIFLEDFDVTREQFIEAMGWGDFLDHVYQDFYPYDDDGHYYLFTYRDFVDAIYGNDPHLTAWVFHDTASYADDRKYQDFYYDDWVAIKRNGDPVWDYIREFFTDSEIGKYRDACQYHPEDDADNVSHLVQFFSIDREQFIGLYGWGDKLDEKATEHFPYAPYTYRQFVDAVYGDDATLRSWVFNQEVFHPDYPTLDEFSTLSEGDRFYCAPLTATLLQINEECTEHNPIYHEFEAYFSTKDVREFKKAYQDRDPEDINIINFVKYYNITREEFIEEIGFALEEADMEMQWMLAERHGDGCPYTYAQFVDAIYGNDPELTEWVFAPEDTWWEREISDDSLTATPPTAPTTNDTFVAPGRDENGNTTTRGRTTTRATEP